MKNVWETRPDRDRFSRNIASGVMHQHLTPSKIEIISGTDLFCSSAVRWLQMLVVSWCCIRDKKLSLGSVETSVSTFMCALSACSSGTSPRNWQNRLQLLSVWEHWVSQRESSVREKITWLTNARGKTRSAWLTEAMEKILLSLPIKKPILLKKLLTQMCWRCHDSMEIRGFMPMQLQMSSCLYILLFTFHLDFLRDR